VLLAIGPAVVHRREKKPLIGVHLEEEHDQTLQRRGGTDRRGREAVLEEIDDVGRVGEGLVLGSGAAGGRADPALEDRKGLEHGACRRDLRERDTLVAQIGADLAAVIGGLGSNEAVGGAHRNAGITWRPNRSIDAMTLAGAILYGCIRQRSWSH